MASLDFFPLLPQDFYPLPPLVPRLPGRTPPPAGGIRASHPKPELSARHEGNGLGLELGLRLWLRRRQEELEPWFALGLECVLG